MLISCTLLLKGQISSFTWVDGRVGDYNATCVAPTDQLRLGLVEVSWSAGARCGNILCPFSYLENVQHISIDHNSFGCSRSTEASLVSLEDLSAFDFLII